MSGRKETYTSITTSELRRLRQQASRAGDVGRQNAILQEINRRNQQAMDNYQRQIRTMNSNMDNLNRRIELQGQVASRETQNLRNQLQTSIRNANERMRAMAAENEQIIREMNDNFSREISQTRRDVANAMNENNRRIESAMQQNNIRIENQIQELATNVESELQNVHNRLDSIDAAIQTTAHNNNVLLEMAQEYDHAAELMLEEIQNDYNVEILCPGRLKPVLAARNASMGDIIDAEKMPENSATARHAARETLEDTMRLYQDVLRAKQEWELSLAAARQTLSVTSGQIDANRTLLLEEEGNASVDVDTWTAGDLSALETRLESLNHQLENPDNLSTQDINGIKDAGLQVSREVDDTASFAVEAFFASQDRAEIAQDIADQLSEMGLSIVGHSYQGNDQRAAHRLHLRNNVTGFEMVVTQTPVTQDNGTLSNRLESDILNYGSYNEEHGDEIARDVLESVSGLGLEQTAVCTQPGYENRASDRGEVANMQQWSTERATSVTKPNHVARGASNKSATA